MQFTRSAFILGPAALAITAAALCASTKAHDRYACNRPQTQEDQHACDLARLDSPDELRHFIQRTRAIYNLYMPDYVSDADVRRWELARSAADKSSARPVGIAQEAEKKSMR